MTPVLFVVAAALGGICRWQLTVRLGRPAGWPLGTFAANVIGCLLAGLAAGLQGAARTVFVVAALGSLTTFSTFATEVVAFARTDRKRAIAYLAATLVASLTAFATGTAL